MHPEVSIIIPAYNTAAYIKRAIESVLEQTFKDFEIVVVDDASTDNTVEVLNSIQDPRLKVFCQAQNGGAGAARNRALKEATGNWIAVLDSDDWYAPQRLERLVHLAKERQADMVADDLFIIEDGAVEPRTTMIQYCDAVIPDVIKIDPTYFVLSDIEGRKGLGLGFSKPLFRREFLVQHNITYKPEIKVSQDFWLDMDCLVRGAKFFLLPEPYYYYLSRYGALTTSTNKIERLTQECDAIAQFLDDEAAYLKHNHALTKALRLKLKETRKIRDYYVVVEPLKQGKVFQAIVGSLQRPLFYQKALLELPKVLYRRLNSVLLGAKVYKKFS
ncbi:MAG: glycosyltransferase family 2 protein [Cyanobacteria bacterium P01_C01_bin.70]